MKPETEEAVERLENFIVLVNSAEPSKWQFGHLVAKLHAADLHTVLDALQAASPQGRTPTLAQIHGLIEPAFWSPPSGPVQWDEEKRLATLETVQRIARGILDLYPAASPQGGVEGASDYFREALKEAFVAGCEAVQANYRPDPDPEFDEAGYDYASAFPLPPSASPKPAPATPTDDDREWALSTAKSLFGEDGKADPNDMAAVAHRAVERAAAAEIALAKAKPAPAEVVELNFSAPTGLLALAAIRQALSEAIEGYVNLTHAHSREGYSEGIEDAVNVKRWRTALANASDAAPSEGQNGILGPTEGLTHPKQPRAEGE